MSARRKAEFALFCNCIVWGSTFVLVKAALDDVSPMLFLALRFTLAAAATLAIFAIRGMPRWTWRTAAAGAVSGTFLLSGYAFQTMGLRLTTASKSAFITGLTSLVVPLLAALVYRTRPQVSEVVGLLVATVGLGLMTLKGSIGSMSRGDFLTVFCAFGFAAHIVTLGHFSEEMRFEVLSIVQLFAAAALSWLLYRRMETPHLQWQPAVVWAILITGILATALAFTIQAWAQQYTTSARTALIYMLEPVIAWMTSYLIVGEGLSGRAVAGAALILGGVVLVEVKPLNPRSHPSIEKADL